MSSHINELIADVFCREWYLEMYNDVRDAQVDPFDHFMSHGLREGRSPNAMFDPQSYWELNKLELSDALTCLEHYLLEGQHIGLLPHPLFNIEYYKGISGGDHNISPLAHFCKVGRFIGLYPTPLFDAEWYRNANADVRVSGIDPLIHYLAHGDAEGRMPNKMFCPKWYRSFYPTSGVTLVDYAMNYSSRTPSPIFDTSWYLTRYNLDRSIYSDPLSHFMHEDAVKVINPSPYFDTEFYLNQCRFLGNSRVDAVQHYLSGGADVGVWPNRYFDPRWYMDRNPDVANASIDPLIHYIDHGRHEGRWANCWFDPLYYSARYVGQVPQHSEAFKHFLIFGCTAGYATNPLFGVEASLATVIADSEQHELSRSEVAQSAYWSLAMVRGPQSADGSSRIYGNRQFLCFVVSGDPLKGTHDGYNERIKYIDQLFSDCFKIYIIERAMTSSFQVYSRDEKCLYLYVDTRCEGARNLVKILARNACAVYAHSALSLVSSVIAECFFLSNCAIFDLHGLPSVECIDNDVRSRELLHVEKKGIIASKIVVTCSSAMSRYVEQLYGRSSVCLPYVGDGHEKPYPLDRVRGKRRRAVYIGGSDYWQSALQMLEIVGTLPFLELDVFTTERTAFEELRLRAGASNVQIFDSVAPESMGSLLLKYDLGFCLRDDSIVNSVAMPTKIVDYIRFGVVPVLWQPEVGDYNELGLGCFLARSLKCSDDVSDERLIDLRISNKEVYRKLCETMRVGIAHFCEVLGRVDKRDSQIA